MVIWVTEAKALPGYRLWVRFSDSAQGEIDLRELIASDHRDIVKQLMDPVIFSNLSVHSDTVVWANGFDLAPEYLRARLDTDAAA